MPRNPTTGPFFAANLLATASDGTWQAIRRARRVEVFDDRIEIDGRKISYPWLRDIRAYGNVLHIEYVLGDGRPVTECFLYNTFLSGTGARRLDEMIARVAIALKRQEASTALPRRWVATILAEPLTDIGGRAAVAVHSPRVAFPPVCPMCIGDPTTVAALRVSSGISERGAWLVPTCDRHTRLDEAIRVEAWSGDSSEVRFSFADRRYAAEFLAMNASDDRSNFRRRGTSTRLAFDLQMGAQFVVYQYAVSVIVASFLQPSGIRLVRAGASRVVAGLPYSLLSLVAGWWGFPAGPIFTLTAIVRNSRGGTDVSDRIVAVLRGESLSALAI